MLGGLLPARTTSAADGTFTAEVALSPGKANQLSVTATTSKHTCAVTVMVTQQSPNATGTFTGTVRDVETGQAVQAAKVAFGTRSATTDAQGRFQLSGVPDGLVVTTISAAGFLSDMASTTLTQGTGTEVTALMQKFAATTTVSSAGGTYKGTGWQVDIPRNAVSQPTGLQFTPLVFTGNEDSYGLPYVDLSPSGRRFSKPVKVTIDPAVLGVDPSAAELVGVNPDTGAATILPVTVSGTQLVTTMTVFDGRKIFGRRRSANSTPDGFCTPYTSDLQARLTRAMLQRSLLPFLKITIGDGSARLWGEYLAGGVPTTVREIQGDDEFLQK
ncbi:carboxypeptidase-like regulatory domain-containing protein [Amycolatopsis sp. lyj-23]|uniref:carboxypeptidase-like regulatory domain-containing protein n=1 Tax=Amycolatopsis sp. lyj-23 TaxID=2789283 RepID=UPI003979C782